MLAAGLPGVVTVGLIEGASRTSAELAGRKRFTSDCASNFLVAVARAVVEGSSTASLSVGASGEAPPGAPFFAGVAAEGFAGCDADDGSSPMGDGRVRSTRTDSLTGVVL